MVGEVDRVLLTGGGVRKRTSKTAILRSVGFTDAKPNRLLVQAQMFFTASDPCCTRLNPRNSEMLGEPTRPPIIGLYIT